MFWGAIAAYLVFGFEPHVPLVVAVVGGLLGVAGGIMQHLSIKEATNGFTSALSMLDVRQAFKSTLWGSRYISLLYFSKFALAVLAFLVIRHPLLEIVLGYLAGYMSLMFLREIVTLRDTFYLQGLASRPDSGSNGDG